MTGEQGPDLAAVKKLNETISARRSVRSFEPGPEVGRQVLAEIAEAGRWAPSGANSQPWEICIVHEPGPLARTAELLAAQADRLNEHCKGFPHVHKKHWVHQSVAIFVVFIDVRWADAYPVANDPQIDQAEYAANRDNILLVSAGAAVQNIQLAATAAGLTSAWLSGGGEPQTAAELQEALGFPETHVPFGTVPVGWPHRRSDSRWRRELDDVIHWNGADVARLRTRDDIDRYIEEERRDSIYRDAQTRQELQEGREASRDEIDPVDDGA